MIAPGEMGLYPRRYRTARGRCPRCDSHEVTHLVIGLPASDDDMQWVQKWVVSVGCVHFGYDRECAACGLGWTGGDEQDRESWMQVQRSFDE